MKKVISVFLAVLMVITVFPLSVFAENTSGEKASGTCGGDLTWVLYNDGEFVISGTGAMYDYWSGNVPWYSNRSSIKKVTINNSVTSIGAYVFEYCYSMTSVTIGDSVTSIGAHAFEYCISLISVTIPDSITSIGSYAFEYCISLISVTIPDSVTSIGDYAFGYCISLKYVFYKGTQKQWNNITIYSYNGYLTSATKYYNVDEDYFLDDNVLFNKNVTLLLAYAKNNNLYIVPDTVKSIEQNAFKTATNLHTVILSESLINIGSNAFYGASNLTNIYIPASVSTIDTYAFADCSSLTNVYFGGTKEQWEAITVSSNNSYLTNAEIHYNSALTVENGAVYTEDMSELICYDSSEAGSSFTVPDTVKIIGARAFKNYENLKEIILPEGLEIIETGAFYNCVSLKEILIPNSITEIKKQCILRLYHS